MYIIETIGLGLASSHLDLIYIEGKHRLGHIYSLAATSLYQGFRYLLL